MLNNNRFLLFLFILSLFFYSCQTSKEPGWVLDPPPDDDLFIYATGVGKGDDVFYSVLDQLSTRFNLEHNDYFSSLIITLLKESFERSNSGRNQKVSIVDRWTNDDVIYILSRFTRSFFDPLIILYSTRYNEMLNYSNRDEISGDILFKDGIFYPAVNDYLSALDFMLKEEDDFYTLSIIGVMDKILNIMENIEYENVETFNLLKIAHSLAGSRLFITYTDSVNNDYSGFLYSIDFSEGWNTRHRSIIVPVRDNRLEFIPPLPKLSGVFNISAKLNIDKLTAVVEPWLEKENLGNYLGNYKRDLNRISINSIVEFDYDVISDIQSLPKIISFNNPIINEGVVRALLEVDDISVVSPLTYGEESLLKYVREINKITLDGYRYMILGKEFHEKREEYEGGFLITLTGEFDLVDLYSSYVITSREIFSEYLALPGEEDIAYLDYGLKAGRIIHDLSF